jgi:hypothetical protein
VATVTLAGGTADTDYTLTLSTTWSNGETPAYEVLLFVNNVGGASPLPVNPDALAVAWPASPDNLPSGKPWNNGGFVCVA